MSTNKSFNDNLIDKVIRIKRLGCKFSVKIIKIENRRGRYFFDLEILNMESEDCNHQVGDHIYVSESEMNYISFVSLKKLGESI